MFTASGTGNLTTMLLGIQTIAVLQQEHYFSNVVLLLFTCIETCQQFTIRSLVLHPFAGADTIAEYLSYSWAHTMVERLPHSESHTMAER